MFTPEQLKNWEAFEEARLNSKFNMLDPRARQTTGLSAKDFMFCLINYQQLRQAHEAA